MTADSTRQKILTIPNEAILIAVFAFLVPTLLNLIGLSTLTGFSLYVAMCAVASFIVVSIMYLVILPGIDRQLEADKETSYFLYVCGHTVVFGAFLAAGTIIACALLSPIAIIAICANIPVISLTSFAFSASAWNICGYTLTGTFLLVFTTYAPPKAEMFKTTEEATRAFTQLDDITADGGHSSNVEPVTP